MKKILMSVLLCIVTMMCFASKEKIIEGSFDVLKNQDWCSVKLDFSKTLFQDNNIERFRYCRAIPDAYWSELVRVWGVAITSGYSLNCRSNSVMLGIEGLKETEYYLLIQPDNIDLNDGECVVTIKLCKTVDDSVLGIAEVKPDQVDKAANGNFILGDGYKSVDNWEANIAYVLHNLGKSLAYIIR